MAESIKTAPRDGTTILTNCGFALYMDQKNWGSIVDNGWACCDSLGHIFECADDGVYFCEPELWETVPDWCS